MKKIILISITATLLLTAVLCTAGCVTEDRIVGTYMAENDSTVIYAVFEKEGTGGFAGVAKEGGISDAMGLPFNWKADGNNAYTLAFADGTAEAASLDAKRGILTIGGVEYEKQASAVSGWTKDKVIRREIALGPGDRMLEEAMAAMEQVDDNLVPRDVASRIYTSDKEEEKTITN